MSACTSKSNCFLGNNKRKTLDAYVIVQPIKNIDQPVHSVFVWIRPHFEENLDL